MIEEKKNARQKVRDQVRRLNEEDLLEAFQYAPNHPLWQAIIQLAETFREACIMIATDPDLTEKESNMTLGGVATMDDWVAELYAKANLQRSKREKITPDQAQEEGGTKA